MPVPVDSLLLEGRKQSYCGHKFCREPEGRLPNDGFSQEVERTVGSQSCWPGQGLKSWLIRCLECTDATLANGSARIVAGFEERVEASSRPGDHS